MPDLDPAPQHRPACLLFLLVSFGSDLHFARVAEILVKHQLCFWLDCCALQCNSGDAAAALRPEPQSIRISPDLWCGEIGINAPSNCKLFWFQHFLYLLCSIKKILKRQCGWALRLLLFQRKSIDWTQARIVLWTLLWNWMPHWAKTNHVCCSQMSDCLTGTFFNWHVSPSRLPMATFGYFFLPLSAAGAR